MINLEMVRRGYARVLTIRPNVRYERWFEQAESEARVAGRGLWGVATSAGPRTAVTASRRVTSSIGVAAAGLSPPGARARRLTNGRHRAPTVAKRPGARQARARSAGWDREHPRPQAVGSAPRCPYVGFPDRTRARYQKA